MHACLNSHVCEICGGPNIRFSTYNLNSFVPDISIRELKQATFLSTRTSAGSKSRRYRWRVVVSAVLVWNQQRQSFSFHVRDSNENGWRHHSPSITTRFTSGWRPCWQKHRLLKLSIIRRVRRMTWQRLYLGIYATQKNKNTTIRIGIKQPTNTYYLCFYTMQYNRFMTVLKRNEIWYIVDCCVLVVKQYILSIVTFHLKIILLPLNFTSWKLYQ